MRPPDKVRRRAILAAILGAGLVLSTVAYVTAPPLEENADIEDMAQSKRHARDLERIAGKSGALANDLDEWLASLWEGKARALTVLLGSMAVAGTYYLATREP